LTGAGGIRSSSPPLRPSNLLSQRTPTIAGSRIVLNAVRRTMRKPAAFTTASSVRLV